MNLFNSIDGQLPFNRSGIVVEIIKFLPCKTHCCGSLYSRKLSGQTIFPKPHVAFCLLFLQLLPVRIPALFTAIKCLSSSVRIRLQYLRIWSYVKFFLRFYLTFCALILPTISSALIGLFSVIFFRLNSEPVHILSPVARFCSFLYYFLWLDWYNLI